MHRSLVLVGMNHRTSAVELREKLAFPAEKLGESLRDLRGRPGIREVLILSTCNRVEVTAASATAEDGLAEVKRFLAEARGVAPKDLDGHLYVQTGRGAILHLFRVSSSLDSMILGEPQIVGQLKDAFRAAQAEQVCGPMLTRVIRRSLQVARRVRTETKIGDNAVSVSFAAVELAKKIFGSLEKRSVLMIGAGEMAELALRHLVAGGVREVRVANRTLERAEAIAAPFHAKAVPLDALAESLPHADIVLASTAASHFVVTPDQVSFALKQRKNRPMFFIDMSVPRNIDPRVNDLDHTYVYDIDDLEDAVSENRERRRGEAVRAEGIVEEEVEKFVGLAGACDVDPTIRDLRWKWEGIRRVAIEKHLGDLPGVTPEQRAAIESLTVALLNKLLHEPLTQLKDMSHEGNVLYVDAARVLFNLNGEAESRLTHELEEVMEAEATARGGAGGAGKTGAAPPGGK